MKNKIKSMKMMVFVKRINGTSSTYRAFAKDIFYHPKYDIHLIRETHCFNDGWTDIRWTCDDLGNGGYANLKYWIDYAKSVKGTND